MFRHDSAFGPLPLKVATDDEMLSVGDRKIRFTNNPSIEGSDLLDVDALLECTGKITSREVAEWGLVAGAKRVLVSGHCDHADTTQVIGATDGASPNARIVSNSSCTTNAIAPLLRALDAVNAIERAHVSTIHCYTGSQSMVDAPRADDNQYGAELSGVLPRIGARTSVAAVRVPCLSVSAIDAVVQSLSPSVPIPSRSSNTLLPPSR